MQKRIIMRYHGIRICENSVLSFSYIYYNAWILCGNSTDFELIYTSSMSDLVSMQIYFCLLYSSSSFLFFSHILQGNSILDMTSHKFKERPEFTYFSPYLSDFRTFRFGPNTVQNVFKIPQKPVKCFQPGTDAN